MQTFYYIAFDWKHTSADTPVRLYYELNAERQEQRKVEEYQDGTLHSADANHGQGTTFLAWEPHPRLAEINSDPQFRAREIASQEFDQVWGRATRRAREPVAG